MSFVTPGSGNYGGGWTPPPQPKNTPHSQLPAPRVMRRMTTTRPSARPTVRPAARSRNLPVVRRGGGGRLIPVGARPGGNAQPGYAGLVDPAQQYVDASVGPALQQIAYERQQQQQADAQRAAAIQDFTRQYLGYVSQVPGQVQGDYNQMLAQQQALGSSQQAALTAANPNPSVQADLSAVNAPAAQQSQVADKLNSAFTGGGAVLYGTGAYIPGNRISRDEASQVAYERGLPAITAARGQQIYGQLLAQSQKAYSDLGQQEAQVRAGEPKLRLDYQSNLASQSAKNQQLNLERRALGLKTQNQGFQQKATAARIGISQGQLNLGKTRLDTQTKISLARLGIAQNAQQIKAATTIQKQSAAKRWMGLGSNLYSKKMQLADSIARGAKTGGTPTGGQPLPPLPWQQALQEMQSEGVPLAMAVPILAHYYPPGTQGRPAKGVWKILGSLGLNYAATPTGVWYPGSTKRPNRPPK